MAVSWEHFTHAPVNVRPVAPLTAAWRIASDVVLYRLRKREAGNLVTSLTLGISLGLTWADLGVRALFGVLLNIFVYLVNDCFDVAIDLAAPGRDSERTRFLSQNLQAGWAVCGVLGAGLATLGALHSTDLLITAIVNTIVIVAYSGALKNKPGIDLLAMFAWGVSMAMVGFPIASVAGWHLAVLLGVLCMVTEAVQVVRDEPSDRLAGVQTTAVVWGVKTTSRLAKLLLLGAAAYAAWRVHPVGAALALGVLVPLRPERASRSWDILRVLFGVTWLALLWCRRA
jgi:4-hydroxybenzoate polyprenyltransferase